MSLEKPNRPTVPPVSTTEEVRALQASGRHVVVADVRWYLDGRDGRAEFEAGHVPGAVWVDLDAALAGHGLPADEGRHPFPTPEEFAASMGVLGIGDDTVVVGCDDTGGMTAGRLVVMLRMIGRDATLLDGGIAAWDEPLAVGPADEPAPLPFTVTPWPADRLAGADEVVRRPGDAGVSIDARSHERFTGAVTAIDPRPGHVPGARSAPWDAVLDPGTRRVRGAADLRSHYAERGIDEATEVVAYCGSGVSACLNVLAMEHAGLRPPRLYVASFSGWSARSDREVETGEG